MYQLIYFVVYVHICFNVLVVYLISIEG